MTMNHFISYNVKACSQCYSVSCDNSTDFVFSVCVTVIKTDSSNREQVVLDVSESFGFVSLQS